MWTLRNLGLDNADVFGPITIGDNVHIGWNAIIMPNVHIGNNVVIGAGAVVAVGVPAHVIQTTDEYRKKVEAKCDYTKDLSWSKKKKYLLKKFDKG